MLLRYTSKRASNWSRAHLAALSATTILPLHSVSLPPSHWLTTQCRRWDHSNSNYRRSESDLLPGEGMAHNSLGRTSIAVLREGRGGGWKRGQRPSPMVLAPPLYCYCSLGLPANLHCRTSSRDLFPLLPTTHAVCRGGEGPSNSQVSFNL